MVKQSVYDFIQETIRAGDESAFVVIDFDDIRRKYDVWKQCLPRVEPFYAVKCNDNIEVLKRMAAWGLNFDCASMGEVSKVSSVGVSPDRIIYANPCKQVSHLVPAYQTGVRMMTFDNDSELKKISLHCKDAIVILRLATDDSKSICRLSQKFGAKLDDVKFLLEKCIRLGLQFGGFSYHVGSGCESEESFIEAIRNTRKAFDIAEKLGLHPKILDIGGGFSGNIVHQHDIEKTFEQMSEEIGGLHLDDSDHEKEEKETDSTGSKEGMRGFPKLAKMITKAVDEYFPKEQGYRIIAEPGRYFVHSCATMAVNVIARRVPRTEEAMENDGIMYYVNDGVYGAFSNVIYDHAHVIPKILDLDLAVDKKHPDSDVNETKGDDRRKKFFESSIWGPSCDGLDCIARGVQLPKLKIGSWLYFENMGAYTICCHSDFNGFTQAHIYYIGSA